MPLEQVSVTSEASAPAPLPGTDLSASTADTPRTGAAYGVHTPAFEAYKAKRVEHWDEQAPRFDRGRRSGSYYHRRLADVYRQLVPPGLRVLEVGCGRGDLLAALRPAVGIGIDFSAEMVKRAKAAHPDLTFVQADAHHIPLDGEFDVIVLSDLINDLWDAQAVFEQLRRFTGRQTRIVMNFYSRVWEMPLKMARGVGMATPQLQQNWFTVSDVDDLLHLAGFERIRHLPETIWPVRTPLVDSAANRFVGKLPPFRWFAMTNIVVARPEQPKRPVDNPVVSVVVPARNESGNIKAILERTPEMGGGTELIFVEGGSSDDTWAAIQRETVARPDRKTQIMQQTGKGKGDAVRMGYGAATGDVLMILDADMTVAPEDLPRFYEALVNGKAEFVNGVRLVYPMEDQAMRFLNLLGNKFFSMAFSWMLDQPIKDTLCGTKVLWKEDYELIAANRSYFGDFDPFGDFDLLFGAARLNFKILDLPIRYRNRTYGDTNISRFRHGVLLLRMVAFAARRLKFR